MLAARSGDVQAFGELVEAESASTFRLCLVMLGSEADARDAAQEAFIRAWRDLPKLRDTRTWGAWLRRVTVRAALDQARRVRRLPEIRPGLPSVVPDPAVRFAERDEMAHAFGRLSIDDRAVLALRFYADLEVPDVAAALGIPLGKANSRLSRALNRLRDVLAVDR